MQQVTNMEQQRLKKMQQADAHLPKLNAVGGAQQQVMNQLQNSINQRGAQQGGVPSPAQEKIDYYGNAMQQAQQGYDAQMAKLREAQERARGALDESRNYSQGVLNKNLGDAMQQAYTQRKLQQKGQAQQLAALGVSGGGSEQAYSNLLNQYQQTRGAAQESHDNALGGLLNQHAQAVAQLEEGYMQRDADAIARMYSNAAEEARYREGFDREGLWRDQSFEREGLWRDQDMDWKQKEFDESKRQYDQQFAYNKHNDYRNYKLNLGAHRLDRDKWGMENLRTQDTHAQNVRLNELEIRRLLKELARR